MIEAILRWSLRHRAAVIAGWLIVAAAGVLAFGRLRVDAFPDVTPVQVHVNALAPALSTEEVERQVTVRLEQALGGLPGLLEMRSLSRFGLSQVTLTFEDGTDIWRARQVATERLQDADLPDNVEGPVLGPVATGLGEVFHYVVTGDRSLTELRHAQDTILGPQLRAVPGVAEINSWGGMERRIEVIVDPADLNLRGLTLHDVLEALEQGEGAAGGSALVSGGEATIVQGLALLRSPEDVAAVVVAERDGVPVRIGDVARVAEGHEPRLGAVTADGKGEVVLGLGFSLIGENGHDVAERLALRLDEVRKALPAGMRAEVVYDRRDLVDLVLHTVRTNLLEAALLVIAVLFALLGNLRAGLIVALAIPLSLLFAFDLMARFGIAASLMSLGALDFGLLVDSSVIQVENAVSRLAGDRSSRGTREIVEEAVIEVRRPTMFGELIIAIVYVPVLLLEGMEGKLFHPMALTVLFALLGSMLLSLTLIPVLASLGLPRHPSEREPLLARLLQRLYAPVLARAVAWPLVVIGLGAAGLVSGAFLASRLGSEFVPRLREDAFAINTVRLAGVSLEESVRVGLSVERTLIEAFPDEVERAWTRTGTAEIATDPMGLEVSDTFVKLTPRDEWTRAETHEELVEEMQRELAQLPGMRVIFTQPIEMRVNEMVAGVRGDVAVKIFGDDLAQLADAAEDVRALATAIDGAEDVSVEQLTGQPVLRIEADRQALARHGMPARELLEAIEAVSGIDAATLHHDDRRYSVAVRLTDRLRRDADALGGVLVHGAGGTAVPLRSLATITHDDGPSSINRESGKRRVTVTMNVRGRDVGSFVQELRGRLDDRLTLPTGSFLRIGGQWEHLVRARARLLIVVPLALGLIGFLLWVAYGRIVDAARVFLGVPFALVGGVVALTLRDLPFSVPAAVGFVALSGVSVLGDMMLVSTVRQLEATGMALREAVLAAARRRLRPVVMTALVASFGFLPMALSTGPGAEVQRPLATVVIGGVLTSTLLTLVILPALYLAVGARRREVVEQPA